MAQENRRRRRRITHLLVVAVLAAIVVLLLQSDLVETPLRRLLVSRLAAALDAEVQIAEVGLRVLPPALTLTGLEIGGGRWPLEVLVERLAVTPSIGLRARIDVRGVRGQWARSPAAPLPERRDAFLIEERLEALRIAHLSVQDGQLEISGQAVSLRSTGLSALLQRRGRARFQLDLNSSANTLLWQDGAIDLDLGPLALELSFGGENLSTAVTVDGQQTRLEVQGSLAELPAASGTIKATARVEEDAAQSLVEALTGIREARATVEASGQIDLREGTLHGRASLAVEAARVAESHAVDATVSLEWQPTYVRIEGGVVRGYGGEARVDGVFGLEEPTLIEARIRGVDVASMLRDAKILAAGRSSSRLELELSADLDLSADRLRFAESATAELQLQIEPKADSGLPLFGDAEVQLDFAADSFRGSFQLSLNRLSELTDGIAIAGLEFVEGGRLEASGSFGGSPGEPSFSAVVTSDGIRLFQQPVELRSVLTGNRRGIEIESLSARVPGGTALGAGSISWIDELVAEVQGELHLLDLATILGRELPWRIAGAGAFEVSGPLLDPEARLSTNLTIMDGASQRRRGNADLTLRRRPDEWILRAKGTLDTGSFQGTARLLPSTSAIEVGLRANGIPLSDLGALAALPVEVGGVVDLELQFEGSLETPIGRATLRASGLTIGEEVLGSLEATMVSNGETIHSRASLAGSQDVVVAAVGLSRPREVVAQLTVAPLIGPARSVLLASLDPMSPWHKALDSVVRLQGSGSVGFETQDLGSTELEYRASIDGLRVETLDYSLTFGAIYLHGTRRRLELEPVELADASGTALRLRGAIDRDMGWEVYVDGSVGLPMLSSLMPSLAAEGSAAVDVVIRGPRLDALTGTFEVDSPRGSWGPIQWSRVEASGRLSSRRLVVERAQGRILGGAWTAKGDVPLLEELEPGRLVLAVRHVDPARLLQEEPERTLYSVLDIDAVFLTKSLDPRSWDGSGTVEVRHLGSLHEWVASAEIGEWTLSSGRLSLEEHRLQGLVSDARISVSVSTDPPRFESRVDGTLGLALAASVLDPTGLVQSEGAVVVHLQVSRDEEALRASGSLRIDDGRILIREPRIELAHLSAVLQIQDRVATIESLQAEMGEGKVEATGSFGLATLGSSPSVDLSLTASAASIELSDGVHGEIGGGIEITSVAERYRITGELELESGILVGELDSRSAGTETLSRLQWGLDDAALQPLTDRIDLDLQFKADRSLRVSNDLVDLSASFDLAIEGTWSQPRFTGLVTAEPPGSLLVGTNGFELRRAELELLQYPDQIPQIDVEAWSIVAGVNVQMKLEGPIDELSPILSAPNRSDLSEEDLTSLLVTGRTLEYASAGIQELASARLANYIGDLLETSGNVDHGIVFGTPSSLSVLSAEDDPEGRLAVGRAITDDLTVSYSVGLEGAESVQWIVDFKPTRSLWLRVLQEASSAYAVEVAQRVSFDQHEESMEEATAELRSVSSVRLEWVGFKPAGELADRVRPRTREGDPYRYWLALEEAKRMRRLLRESDYLGAAVDLHVSPEGRTADLTYEVFPGPRIEISWRGDDPGKRVRNRLVRSWSPGAPAAENAEDLARSLEHILQARGHYLATVTATVERLQTDRGPVDRVVIDVENRTLGEHVVVVFTGNERLSSEELRAVLPSPSAPELFALLSDRDELEETIGLRYADEGYLGVDVHTPQLRYEEASRTLRVEIFIVEGEVSRLDELVVLGAVEVPVARIVETVGLRQDEPFELDLFLSARSRLTELYRAEGLHGTRLAVNASRVGQDVRVEIRVSEGRAAHVGAISVRGLGRIKERFVLDHLTFSRGDRLLDAALRESERRLYDLGAFRSVRITLDGEPGPATPITIDVKERPRAVLDYGLRFRRVEAEQIDVSVGTNRAEGLTGAGRLQHYGSFNRPGFLNTSYFPGPDGHTARLGYQTPLFFGRRLTTDIYLEGEIDDVEMAPGRRETLSLTFQQRRRLQSDRTLQWSYQLGRGRLTPRSDSSTASLFEFDRWIQWAHVTGSLIVDRRNRAVNPSQGLFWTATVQAGGHAVGSDFDFLRLFGRFSSYHPLTGGEQPWIWASGLRVGLIENSEPFILLDERFMAGGAYSFRGVRPNALGPLTLDGRPIGGEAMVLFNQEIRFPIRGPLHGGIFLDVGNIFLEHDDFDIDELRESAGVGLRAVLPFGVVRLDWATLLDRRPGEPKSRFHFALGHAF